MDFEEVIKAEPKNALAFSRMAIALSGLEETEKALEAHRKAKELNPLQAEFPLNLGSDLFGLGKVDEALRSWTFPSASIRVSPCLGPGRE